ncbi:urea ABC transporter permease subunit UrtC [Desulfotomaculum nigrificans]|nr:urea ABC transporter permease subunit UrtC [Desulfotomaculum nigrificans]
MSTREKWLFGILAITLFVVAPLLFSDFRLNLMGKFLAFAILAIALDLIWGYTGILSLGHGVFFGLGAYAMGMYLKLEAAKGHLPDFMSWSGLTELPWFWKPFQYPGFAILMAVAIPMVLALVLGYLTFRNRIHGVYFSVMTQALALIFVILFVGQQPYTGGTNGITDFKTIFGFSLTEPAVKMSLYLVTAFSLALVYFLCRWLTNARLGRVLVAIRDGENRVRFSGYNPVVYKLFVFVISAGLAGLAGALFAPQVGIVSPALMGIVPSIEIAIWVAVGGRGTLIGAVIGSILVNGAKSLLSETFPDVWLYFLGILFVSVVLFPNGIMGLFAKLSTLQRKEVKAYGRNNPVFGKCHR